MATTSWINSVWSRRILLAVILIGAWPAWHNYTGYQDNKNRVIQEKTALAMAEIWVATSRFRDRPEAYDFFRDSLLASQSFTQESFESRISELQDIPDRQLAFFKRVSSLVDSLVALEHSLRIITESVADTLSKADSLSKADTLLEANSLSGTDTLSKADIMSGADNLSVTDSVSVKNSIPIPDSLATDSVSGP